jgi:enamine deaminase RidA (YjgF/YER057c/UK114 family)
VFERLRQALALGGATLNDVCKVNVWLHDARDFGSFNRVYMECFGEHRPARSTVESRLMIDAKVEIDVIAYKPR